jgi:hypothetical protein
MQNRKEHILKVCVSTLPALVPREKNYVREGID